MTAYVIGNGVSRKPINLKLLNGPVYGCNAIYRDFTPDVLVATDKLISRAIQDSGYAKRNRFHTRHVCSDTGAKGLDRRYAGWSSGPNALQLAVHDKHKDITLIGFDFGSIHDKFNNVYADTEFYKKSTDGNTYSGNWVKQIMSLIQQFPKVHFTFVLGKDSNKVDKLLSFANVDSVSVEKFIEKIS